MPAALRMLALLLPLCLSAPAFAVHKCGGDGAASYSNLPCENARPLKPERGGQDAAAARRLEQEKKTLKELERSRHQRETQAGKEQQRAARAGAVRERKCIRLERELRWAEEDARAAAGKRVDRARLKAKRAAEEYEESCRHRAGLQIGGG